MKKLLFLLFLNPIFLFAQNIEGVIIDKKSNLPIEDVNVSINAFNISTITNAKGVFKLSLTNKIQENDTVHFSRIGYIAKKISLSELKKNEFKIFLNENIDSLNAVTISGKKSLKLKIAYTKLAPLPFSLSSFGSILNDNKIYVIGGDGSFKTDAWKKVQYEKVDVTLEDYIQELRFQFTGQSYNGNLLSYDLKTGQWEVSKMKFRKRAYHNLNEYNNSIYVLGGKRISTNGVFEYLDDKIEVFDLKKQTIAIDNTNPHQAAGFASFTYKNTLITMGGSVKMNEDGVKKYSNQVHSYDINSGYWYKLPDMPSAKETNGVLIQDKIYLIGGNNSKPISVIESYNLSTEKWETEGELFQGLSNPAITSFNDIIYIFENENIYTYNIHTKELKEYSINLPMKASKMHYWNNKLYLLGGYLENYYSTFPTAAFFSIDITEFSTTKPNRVKFL